jgi:hypothetical protein
MEDEGKIALDSQKDNGSFEGDSRDGSRTETPSRPGSESALWLGEEVRDLSLTVGTIGVVIGMGIAYLFNSRKK